MKIYNILRDADTGSGTGGAESETLLTGEEGAEVEAKETEAPEGETLLTEGAESEEAEKEEAAGAPEEYEEFTMPEGLQLDEELNGEFTTVAKDLNLTQDQAQKLADLYTAQISAQKDTWDTMVEGWRAEAEKDPEIGGEKFQENLASARGAVKEFGSNEFRDMLNTTGVGNHPAMLKFLYRVGEELREGSADTSHGGSGTGTSKTLAQRLYT
jgi:hypothetical protein